MADAITRVLDDVWRERHRQVDQFGHTAAADDERDAMLFAGEILDRARALQESIHFGKGRELIRSRCIRIAAMATALAEKLDREIMPEGE